MTGVACKPGCVANRGNSDKAKRREASYTRQRQKHDAATIRHADEAARAAAEQYAAAAMFDLEARWGTRADALKQLGEVSQGIELLRREQDAAVLERDELVSRLREVGESWNSLAARTGLSRQALGKRTPSSPPPDERRRSPLPREQRL